MDIDEKSPARFLGGQEALLSAVELDDQVVTAHDDHHGDSNSAPSNTEVRDREDVDSIDVFILSRHDASQGTLSVNPFSTPSKKVGT